jgi:dTDP-4-dehydrorhamnose reductase
MIVVFGAGGLLGSHLVDLFPNRVIGLTREQCDVTDVNSITPILYKLRPKAIINCAGYVPKHKKFKEDVNSTAPFRISRVSRDLDIRFIQISTNCVFDGTKGNYSEIDKPDPVNTYGKSKLMGEPILRSGLVVRTSFIGLPDPKGRGLLAWLLQQEGKEIEGYSNVMWNGLSAAELSYALITLADREDIRGLVHLHNYREPISKYSLLKQAIEIFELDIKITSVEKPVENLTLSSLRKDVQEAVGLSKYWSDGGFNDRTKHNSWGYELEKIWKHYQKFQ